MKVFIAVALTASILSVAGISNANAVAAQTSGGGNPGNGGPGNGGSHGAEGMNFASTCDVHIVKKLVNGKQILIKKCDYRWN